jgi:GR25 family glycosyltransferase involved in LPS biosynthesis
MNFDIIPNSKTFILTIQRNKARFDATMEHLRGQQIEPTVFHGLDGDTCGLETRWEIKYKGDDTPEIIRRWVALYFSHFAMWKMCSYQPYDAFVILEDDVRLVEDWKFHLAMAMEDAPPDWDLIFVGNCCTDGRPKTQIKERLWKVDYVNCTHAYVVRAKALRTLLEKCERVDMKLDLSITLNAVPHLNTLALLPTLALQEGTILPP